MPSPSTMTKEVLKKELQDHGIKLPSPRARKEVFLQLYETLVLKKAGSPASAVTTSPVRRRRGRPPKLLTSKTTEDGHNAEFSSDDDSSWIALDQTPVKNLATEEFNLLAKKDKVEMEKHLTVTNVDVSSLSDDQLYEMLQSHGAPVGPIVGTTRKLYERKLAKLMHGITDDFDENEFSDEDSTYHKNTTSRSTGDIGNETIWNNSYSSPYRSTISNAQSNTYKSLSQTSPYLRTTKFDHPTDVSEIVEQIREPPTSSHLAGGKQSHGIPLWVKLMIVVLLVILVVLVYQNMEDDSSNPIPYQSY